MTTVVRPSPHFPGSIRRAPKAPLLPGLATERSPRAIDDQQRRPVAGAPAIKSATLTLTVDYATSAPLS